LATVNCHVHIAMQIALRKGRGEEATRYYEISQETISNATDDVDWYQVLLHHIPDDEAAASLETLWGTLLLAVHELVENRHETSSPLLLPCSTSATLSGNAIRASRWLRMC
jgi:hypothetical protein